MDDKICYFGESKNQSVSKNQSGAHENKPHEFKQRHRDLNH